MATAGSAQLSSEIDAQCWSIISEAVAANDCEKMASVYHPDAVLVNTIGATAQRRLAPPPSADWRHRPAPWRHRPAPGATRGPYGAVCGGFR